MRRLARAANHMAAIAEAYRRGAKADGGPRALEVGQSVGALVTALRLISYIVTNCFGRSPSEARGHFPKHSQFLGIVPDDLLDHFEVCAEAASVR